MIDLDGNDEIDFDEGKQDEVRAERRAADRPRADEIGFVRWVDGSETTTENIGLVKWLTAAIAVGNVPVSRDIAARLWNINRGTIATKTAHLLSEQERERTHLLNLRESYRRDDVTGFFDLFNYNGKG